MDNGQFVENMQLASSDIGSYMTELKERGDINNDVLKLVKRDLEYGYSREMVETYIGTGWGIERMRELSEIIGKTTDKEFISFIKENQFSARQMRTLLEFHLKNISVEDMIEVTGKGMSEFAVKKMLGELAKAQEQVEDAKEKLGQEVWEDEKSKEIMEKISEMVSGIGDNKDFLEKVLTKLEQLDAIKKNGDDVKESFSHTIETQEKLISEQQTSLNQQAKELARKNTSIENLTAELDAAKKEAKEAGKERNEMERKLEELQKENEALKRKADRKEDVKTEEQQRRMPDSYEAKVTGANGIPQTIQVERMTRRSPDGLLALAGKKLFKGKNRLNLIVHLKNANLNTGQMQQVKAAIEAGLTDEEVVDIINSGFSAEEMAQAIEIVLAEKMYG